MDLLKEDLRQAELRRFYLQTLIGALKTHKNPIHISDAINNLKTYFEEKFPYGGPLYLYRHLAWRTDSKFHMDILDTVSSVCSLINQEQESVEYCLLALTIMSLNRGEADQKGHQMMTQWLVSGMYIAQIPEENRNHEGFVQKMDMIREKMAPWKESPLPENWPVPLESCLRMHQDGIASALTARREYHSPPRQEPQETVKLYARPYQQQHFKHRGFHPQNRGRGFIPRNNYSPRDRPEFFDDRQQNHFISKQ